MDNQFDKVLSAARAAKLPVITENEQVYLTRPSGNRYRVFDPLSFAEDTLTLIANLKIDLLFGTDYVEAQASFYPNKNDVCPFHIEELGEDKLAAIKAAVVETAAKVHDELQ